jgi:hypothetical protein
MSQCRARLDDGDRCDTTAAVNLVTGNGVHDNIVVMDAVRNEEGTAFALAWVRDIRDERGEAFTYMFTAEAANSGWGNRYWLPGPPGEVGVAFAWGDQSISDLDTFNDTPGEENGVLIDGTERDRILVEAGIPTEPGRRVGGWLMPRGGHLKEPPANYPFRGVLFVDGVLRY